MQPKPIKGTYIEEKCTHCELTELECICGYVDEFFLEYNDVMKDLAEIERLEKLYGKDDA